MYNTQFTSVAPRAPHDCLRVPGLPPSNPFSELRTADYGLEDFDRITPQHILEAAEAAVAHYRATLALVIADPSPPTFDNTIKPLELAQGAVNRVHNVIAVLNMVHNFEGSADVAARVRTLVADCRTDMQASQGLVERIQRLHAGVLKGYDGGDAAAFEWLTDEQRHLIDLMFQRQLAIGVHLGPGHRARLHDITEELEHLRHQFTENFEAASDSASFWVSGRTELAGMPESRLVAMRAAARDRDPARFDRERGGYLMEVRGTHRIKDLEHLHNRDLRRRVYERGQDRAADTNLPLAIRISTLRAEAARLLGYATHVHRKTHLEASGTPEVVTNLLHELTEPVMRQAEAELEVLRDRARRDGIDNLEPWDIAYYLEAVRNEQFHLDHDDLMNYLELRNVVEYGLFHAAKQLYGLTFRRRMDLFAYHHDAQVYEVFDGPPGPRNSGIGLLINDLYARDDSTNNTWTHAFTTDVGLLRTQPIVVLSSCLDPPTYGVPSLLTLAEVIDLFRSFGHMLHLLLGRSHYPDTSALELPFDYLFYPMQVNGMWATSPDVMRNYAIHVDTGELIPRELIDRIARSASWGMGLATAVTLAATVVDLAWHSLEADAEGATPHAPRTPAEARAFERDALLRAGIDLPGITDYPITQVFAHAFAYADSGYYAYLFSDCLEAETVTWFTASGGLTRENGEAFKRSILEPAATRAPLTAFRRFAGAGVAAAGFLRRYGFGLPVPLTLEP
ncbi:hypothetical protein JT358_08640 [Micrococcales bacterium 31B]|nr:hypothetical protein [Micrococcales bacterium 31B]